MFRILSGIRQFCHPSCYGCWIFFLDSVKIIARFLWLLKLAMEIIVQNSTRTAPKILQEIWQIFHKKSAKIRYLPKNLLDIIQRFYSECQTDLEILLGTCPGISLRYSTDSSKNNYMSSDKVLSDFFDFSWHIAKVVQAPSNYLDWLMNSKKVLESYSPHGQFCTKRP